MTVIVLGHEACCGKAGLLSPINQVLKIDVRSQVLSPAQSVDVWTGETLMVIIGPKCSFRLPVVYLCSPATVIDGDHLPIFKRWKPVVDPGAVTVMDLQALFRISREVELC